MASASDNGNFALKEMEDLSCYICYQLFTEPKDLDCPHVYCLQCLQDWVGKEPTIDCPECRHITIVPPGGLSYLKTNLRLQTMAEKYATKVEKQKGVPLCENHEGERQHFFCVTCGVTVCHNCLVLDHERPRHEIKELKVITKTRKTEITTKMNRVKEELIKVEDEEKQLSDIERKVQAARNLADCEIDRRVGKIIAETEAKRKEMKDRVHTISQQHLKVLQEEKNRVKDRAKRLTNVHSATQNVVESAADHVYLKQHASLVDKMEKLCIDQYEIPTSDMACLHFNQGTDPVNTAWFGKVVENDHRKRKLTLVTEFGTFEKAQGVAATKTGLLAVVDYESEEVIVYRDDNGKYERQFCLCSPADDAKGKLTPFDVCVTSDNKFIVKYDRATMQIFTPTGKCEKSLSIYGGRITTTPDDAILINDRQRGVITMYKPNGELLRTHQVGTGKIEGIATNCKLIAFTKPYKNEVCVIDFESSQELWRSNMTFPLGICYDEKSDSILVAGGSKTQGKIVIDQYCSTTGRKIATLATGLYNPLAMTMTHDGKLAVADWKSVKVNSIE